jgi:hypothetical protein
LGGEENTEKTEITEQTESFKVFSRLFFRLFRYFRLFRILFLPPLFTNQGHYGRLQELIWLCKRLCYNPRLDLSGSIPPAAPFRDSRPKSAKNN